MELEESSFNFKPVPDRRPLMPPPPPVRLIAIDDVHVPAAAGLERELDAFYVGLFGFERQGHDEGHLTYKSENFLLCFDVLEPPIERDDFRPIGIEVPSLSAARATLTEREIEHEFQRGLMPGVEIVLVRDPAGNWVSVSERRAIS